MMGISGVGSPYMYGVSYNAVGGEANNNVQGLGKTECTTCATRKYQDGSNENVSFKSPGHISPSESYGKVMSHEKEHVANAVAEGSKPNKELVSVSVSLRTAVCPECGRSYVSGGTTTTMMRTYNDDAYGRNRKAFEQEAMRGNNIDYSG